jgi:cytochrome c biogenesis protein CcmG, thiol:disulfide interchange protein DsbE
VKNKTLILIIVVFVGILIVFFASKSSRGPERAEIGRSPQDFEIIDINKKSMPLSSMKGSVVFVNFWATWCESCIDELPSIERLSRHFTGNPTFKIVTILYKDDLNAALSFMKERGYTFPVYLNPDEYAAKMFGITGIPETFIIDKKGILRDKVIGPAGWDSPNTIQSFQALIDEP